KPVRTSDDADLADQVSVRGGDCVHDAVVSTRQPQHLAVGRDATHVRAAAAGDAPLGDQLVGGEAHYRNRSLAAISDVEVFRVAADIEPMCPGAGGEQPGRGERIAVEYPDAIGHHVGDVPRPPVRRDLHVLRHWHPTRQMQLRDDPVRFHVDLEQVPGELAADDHVPPVGREVCVVHAVAPDVNGELDGHRVRVTEDDLVLRLGHDDRELTVGREVKVVRVLDRHRATERAGDRVDGRQRVAVVAVDPQGTQVPGG